MQLVHDLLDDAAATHGASIAVSDEDGSTTYEGLRVASVDIARGLRDAGVERGDRVVVVGRNSASIPALLFGISRVGAVFIVARAPVVGPALTHVLLDSGAALVVTDDLEAMAVAISVGVRALAIAELLVHCDDPVAPYARDALSVDAVSFIYTSGSTGEPKAVVSTHAQVLFAARAIGSRISYASTDVVYCALPLSFDYGLYQIFLCALSGAHLVLASERGAGAALLQHLEGCRATVFPAVPSLAINLLRMLGRAKSSSLSLRLLTNTGAAMPDAVLAGLRHHVNTLHVQLMFGLTECKRAAIMPLDGDLVRPGASGLALPETEIFAVDPTGARLSSGEYGELVVRGPNVMSGYWNQPALTAERFYRRAGLFPELRTGDFGHVDEEGYVYFTGRRDDQYKERGTRCTVSEVEAAAYRVEGVEGAAVVPPRASEDGACLVVVTNLAPPAVLRGLSRYLDVLKVPSRCQVVDELPLTRNGKLDRTALVAQVQSVVR